MKMRIILFALLSTTMLTYAQQDAQYTQYMYNTININPAYAGSRGALSMFALYRAQWIGLDGAPVTSTVSVNTPLNNSNLGLGLSVVNDKLGPTTENAISADFSYTIKTSEVWKLSFGIKATANLFDLDISKLDPRVVDKSLQNINTGSFNFGAGFYLRSDNAYLGFSIPNFIETTRYNNNEIAVFEEKPSYYMMGGLVFDLNDTVKFKPAFLGKMSAGSPIQLDFSGNFLFNEKFMLGATYRWSKTISAMLGFQISEGMYIGYGYDRESNNLGNFNSGSHEIFLRYEFLKNISRITTPRFF